MKRSNRFVFVLLLCANCAPIGAADDYLRNARVDVLHYRLNLRIKDASDEIQGEAEILFEFRSFNPPNANKCSISSLTPSRGA